MATKGYSDPYLQPRNQPTSNKDTLFLLEVEGMCPKCGKPLLVTKGTRSHKLYQIAHIYPNSPLPSEITELAGLERLGSNCEDSENKIALCKDCHGYYDDHKTKDEYLWYVSKKKELMNAIAVKHAGYSFSLEAEISEVIRRLSSAQIVDLSELTYRGVPIASKIPETHLMLKTKVSSYVTTYFHFIQDTFFDLDLSKQLNFKLISNEVHSFFLKCDAEGLDYAQTFHAIVDWIKAKSLSSSIEACEAIVSFFVQDCEVFYELAE